MSLQTPLAVRPPPDSPGKLLPRLSGIRFHLPYERLQRRRSFGQQLQRLVKEEQVLRLDNFALFDAVAKRGGFQQVVGAGRWEEIALCLQYEKKFWGYQKYYQEVLLPMESELLMLCGWYGSTLEGETLEMHLLPANNLTTSYYHLTTNEHLFAQAHFFSLDEYFNLKTLALTPADLTRIPQEYAEKYAALKKWLLFAGQLRLGGPKEAKLLAIPNRPEVRVAIIGLSLASLLVADRLSEFGVSVAIVDKGRRQGRMRDDFQVVENGVMILEGGSTRNSYSRALEQSSILLGDVALPPNGMLVLDEDGKPYAEQRIRISQEHFFGILQELRGEVMSRKNLYEQVVTRMIRRKLDHERFLIRWHYDRYMTFNRLKGDATTVADLAAYEAKKFAKHIAHGHSLAVILSVQKLLARVRERKNVSIVHHPIDHVSQSNDTWTIHTRTDPLTANYLLYADQETVFRGVLDGNPKLQEFSTQVMGDSLGILQQLTVMKYINCLFRFREKLLLREPLKNQTCFSICCAHGFVYFFVLNSGTEIMAVLKCYHTSNINYYSEILAILESKCLVKNNRLVNEELFAYEYTFGVKDEKFMEAIVRIKRHERMSMLLPITTTNCPHRMAALVDLANYLVANILDELHPNYQHFDPAFRELFRPKETSRRGREGKEVKERKKEGSATSLPNPNLPSLPNFPSNKSVSEEQQPKIKIITVIPNQPATEILPKPAENELPPVLSLTQMQDDWFGLKHTIVGGHQQFIKNRVESSPKLRESLTSLSQLSLSSPIMLYPGTYLASLGNPCLKEQEWFSCILPSPPAASYLFILNGFTSRREFVSLTTTLRTTVYFQTVLMVDNDVYYVIIDEEYPDVRYFHKNLTTLVQIFSKKLETLRNEELGGSERNYAGLKIARCRFEPHPPSELLPSVIEQAIREELADIKDTPLEEILDRKLHAASTSNPIQRYMGSDPPVPVPSPSPPPSPSQIYRQICAYVASLTVIYELREFTPFQLFFGWLNEQYMACDIMRKFTGTPLTYFDLEKMDEPLCKQVQEVFSRNVPNQLYGLLVAPEEGTILFHRNFLHPTNRRALQRYTYLHERQDGKSLHFLLEEGRKVELSDKNEAMVQIIGKLTAVFEQEEIIDHFQRLVNIEVENEANLSPRMKTFYRMTKKNISETPPTSSVTKLMDKCRGLTEQQKNSIFMLMKRGRIRWINGEMILVQK